MITWAIDSVVPASKVAFYEIAYILQQMQCDHREV
jgi:hypothetical protein